MAMADDTDVTGSLKYRQLAASVRAKIADGTLRRGDPTPSITDLAARNGCSRQTCAHALRMLVSEGLLTRYPGLGYYVTG
jgi:DNA-binding GntR family transcriptional regulator